MQFTKFCWVGKYINRIIKPTNPPTHGQPNPKQHRLKVAFIWSTSCHSKCFSWGGMVTRDLAIQRYILCCLHHLPVQRESITNHTLFRRHWTAKPLSYREIIINGWVYRHWTFQAGFRRLMATFSPFHGVRKNDRSSTRSTSELNKTTTYAPRINRNSIQPTEQ